MNFTRHLDRLAAALAALAGLLPGATPALWRPAASVLRNCWTVATQARPQSTRPLLGRWEYGTKCSWP